MPGTSKARTAAQTNPTDNKREIKVLTYFFVALFLGMMVYLGNFVYHNEQDMINNSYNSRTEILLSKNYRGSILAQDGEVLAETVIDSFGNEKRKYPYGSLFSHSVGYATNGRLGIEALCNYYLINSNLNLSDKVANSTINKKNPGDNVYSTLDVAIQEAANKALGIYDGAIIVTEVKTGRILCMLSKPDFDPHEIAEIWPKLVEDKESTVLLNRVTQGLYPPGSTFKIVTALEYIRQNPSSYATYNYSCNGSFRYGDSKISCYHGANHGAVSFEKSFAKSCNSSFANIGTGLDMDKFANTLDKLMFNKELPFDVSKTSISSLAVSEEMSEDDRVQTSIGQGKTLITPLHLNMITAAIANDGELMEPYMVDKIVSYDGKVIKSYKPSSVGRLMTENEASILQEMMAEVVQSGTATKLKGHGYEAAGKTGSAEYNSNSDSHAWFTGFAPADEPEIAVTVIVESAGSGGDYAVPMARRVFDAYFAQ